MAITADDILDLVSSEALVDRDKLSPEATLESLGIASLDMISIVFALEDRFAVVLEPSDFEGARTVADLVALVIGKSPGSAP